MRKTDIFTVDGAAVLIPDRDLAMEETDVVSPDSGWDESGVYHRFYVRKGVKSWDFSYSRLTREEYAYMENLLAGKDTFRFGFLSALDGSRQEVTAYCGKRSVLWHSAADGQFREYRFRITECSGGREVAKYVMILGDDREFSSGVQGEIAIAKVTLTEKVNQGKDLNPGAVCPVTLEAELLGQLHIPIGTDLTLCRVQADGSYDQVGVFTVAQTLCPGANRYVVTAYDRLSWLDKDLTAWLDGLDGWPYSLQEFARMVCEACDLDLQPGYFTNGEWPVHKFTVVNVTGRELMGWVGELSCRFCRAKADGEIYLDWYRETETALTGGDGFVFMEPFSRADYLTDVIDKVIIRADRKERGFTYGTGGNAYMITGNLLMAVVPNASFEGLARVLYEQLCQIRYTPCTVAVPGDSQVKCGDILRFRDRASRDTVMYVMKKTQRGEKAILECTGRPRRRNGT